jgi:hypothetical protein
MTYLNVKKRTSYFCLLPKCSQHGGLSEGEVGDSDPPRIPRPEKEFGGVLILDIADLHRPSKFISIDQ